MVKKEYSIKIKYNFDRPDLAEASKQIFSAVTKRRLEFHASLEREQSDRSVRASITHGGVQAGYRPIIQGMSGLDKALDRLR
jgi:hypothetical protein